MLVSAPFDDWWHNAYGLDVKIISPPHMVLAAGFFGIELGTVMLLLAFMNRSGDDDAPPSSEAVPVCRRHRHLRIAAPEDGVHQPVRHALGAVLHRRGARNAAVLVAIAVASRQRWACTIMAAVYTAFGLAFLWILPLVPAEPKLGPVYRQVTHFIPWEFPLLVVVPALAIDLILQRTEALAADRRRAGRRHRSF